MVARGRAACVFLSSSRQPVFGAYRFFSSPRSGLRLWRSCPVVVVGRRRCFASSGVLSEQQAVFSLFDVHKDGTIAVAEVGLALRALGQDISDSEARAILKVADVPSHTRIKWQDVVVTIAERFPIHTAEEAAESNLSRLFRSSSEGHISAPDLRQVINTLGEKLTDEELEDIICLAAMDAKRLGLNAAQWTRSERTTAAKHEHMQVDIPASLLESAVLSQVSTYDERYRKGQERSGQTTNPDAQLEAFGQRDATGVEAVHDAMPTEAEAFGHLVSEAIHTDSFCNRKTRTLYLLDFGCGDGRYLQLFLRTAQSLQATHGIDLQVVAYDISFQALHALRVRAERAGLVSMETDDDVLVANGLTLRLVLGDGRSGVEDIANLLQSVRPSFDLIVIGWGTLSCIPRLPNISAEALLRLFARLGRHVMNVTSSTNNHVTFQQEFKARRRAYEETSNAAVKAWLQPKIGLATFGGSYYYPLDTGGRQFYAAVTAEQEAIRLKEAGFTDVHIRICNIINFFDISTKPRSARIDATVIQLLRDGAAWEAQLLLCHGVAKVLNRPFAAVWRESSIFDTSSELACIGQVARYFISTGTSSLEMPIYE